MTRDEPPIAHFGGHHVLVVEDEDWSALLLVYVVANIGVAILGPFRSMMDALRLAEYGGMVLTLLDLGLRGELVQQVVPPSEV